MLYPTELQARAGMRAGYGAGVKCGGVCYARNYARQLAGHVLAVGGAHDVVAIEHRARLVARDSHRHSLDDASVHHVADGGSPEVVGDGRGDLEMGPKVPPHRLVLVVLEEPLPGSRLLQLADHRQPEQLPVLVREPQHPTESSQLPVDGSAGGALSLPLHDVGVDLSRPDARDTSPREIAVQMLEPRKSVG